jgi:hypothetical protein
MNLFDGFEEDGALMDMTGYITYGSGKCKASSLGV